MLFEIYKLYWKNIMEVKFLITEYFNVKVIQTTVKGEITISDRNGIALQTIEKMREEKISKIIWDIREAKFAYSLVGSHEFIVDIKQLGVDNSDYLAVVYFNDKQRHEHSKIVAYNRGIVNLQYFQDIDKAIEWLVSK